MDDCLTSAVAMQWTAVKCNFHQKSCGCFCCCITLLADIICQYARALQPQKVEHLKGQMLFPTEPEECVVRVRRHAQIEVIEPHASSLVFPALPRHNLIRTCSDEACWREAPARASAGTRRKPVVLLTPSGSTYSRR